LGDTTLFAGIRKVQPGHFVELDVDSGAIRTVRYWEPRFQVDPHWRDLVLFYEYFHGDTGAGLGASHQTGWTGLVAKLAEQYGRREEGG